MIAKDDIVIRKAILHILDTNRGECILSNTLLDPGPDLHDFIRNHIYTKPFPAMIPRTVSLIQKHHHQFTLSLKPGMNQMKHSFIETSQAIANKLYVAMGEGLDIPAADLLFVSFPG